MLTVRIEVTIYTAVKAVVEAYLSRVIEVPSTTRAFGVLTIPAHFTVYGSPTLRRFTIHKWYVAGDHRFDSIHLRIIA
jgi:hypothetical protein